MPARENHSIAAKLIESTVVSTNHGGAMQARQKVTYKFPHKAVGSLHSLGALREDSWHCELETLN